MAEYVVLGNPEMNQVYDASILAYKLIKGDTSNYPTQHLISKINFKQAQTHASKVDFWTYP
jgi:hypothetical protein